MSFLPAPILGGLTFIYFCVNTVFWCSLLFVMAGLKLILPFKPARKVLNQVLSGIAECWISGNRFGLWATQETVWDFQEVEGLSKTGTYLVTCNHQSWADIVALQFCFNRRIPLQRFFIKKILFWVPVLGQAWWALEFPFMERYTKEFLAQHPERRGKDLETVKKACERFREMPVTILNFVEGTRFTAAKHERQKSPYRNLLNPKLGGTAAVIAAMGDTLDCILDVTIAYPGKVPTFWDLIARGLPRVILRVKKRPIPEEFRNAGWETDAAFRERFAAWLQALWQEKDAELDELVVQKTSS